MQSVAEVYNRIKQYVVVNVLYVIVIWIFEIDLGKPKTVSQKIVSCYKEKTYDYPTASMDSSLPPSIKGKPTQDYTQILKDAINKGCPIEPIKHHKPISKTIFCPRCDAPYNYIFNNAPKKVKHRQKKVQSYMCKICSYQWYPSEHKEHAVFRCPFCRDRLKLTKTRQEYDIFICRNPLCPYFMKERIHYIYRDYFFNVHELVLASPSPAPINLTKIHYSNNVLGLALVLHVNFRLSYRRTSDFLEEIFGIKIASSTIYNWVESVASLMTPLVTKLPITTSGILVADETYERYAGCWGYYYACLDGVRRYLVAPHFSPKRNIKATATCLVGALKRIQNPPKQINIVHDHFPTYFLAVQLINQSKIFPFKVTSQPVKGLKDQPDAPWNPWRQYKNIVERYFGTAKPVYYLTRGFGSVQGAISHHILHAIDYNYFHPHEFYKFEPPIKIPNLKSNHPIEKWNKLIQLASSLN